MVVVQTLSSGQPGHTAQIGGGVVEVLVTRAMAHAVDDGAGAKRALKPVNETVLRFQEAVKSGLGTRRPGIRIPWELS